MGRGFVAQFWSVIVDIKTLHKNVPNFERIKTAKTSHNNFPRKATATKVMPTFPSLILTLNNFVFNCKNYIQIKYYAMGTISPHPLQTY